jgi:hypothetical protein
MVRRLGLVGLSADDSGDVLAMQPSQRLAAMRQSEMLKDVATR